MKRNLLLLLALLAFLTTWAQGPNGAHLNVRMWDGAPCTVILGREAFMQPSPEVTLNDIQPGRYRLQVFRNAFAGRPGELFYDEMVDFMPFQRVALVVRGPNQAEAFVENGNAPRVVNSNAYYNGNNGGRGQNQGGGRFVDPYQPVGPPCMNDAQFGMLLSTIENMPFDENRLNVAKQATADNGINAQQVREIVARLTFESAKLDFAKYAYGFTVNPQDYFIVNDAFTFPSSVNELSRYIASVRGY